MRCDRMQGKDLAAVDSSSLVDKHILRNDRRVANLEIVLRFSPCRSRASLRLANQEGPESRGVRSSSRHRSPAAGQARVSSATTAERAAPVRSAASTIPMAPERSGPRAASLSPEFWLHQPLAPAGICDRRFYTVWRSRVFHASADAPAWLFATAAGIRDRLLRWLLRGVRPGDVHNPELGGSAGLIRGFGRCAHALLRELCAALDSAMRMTSQWAAKS